VPRERRGDRRADRAGGGGGHEGEHRAAEPAAHHPRAERARGQRRLHRRVGFGPGDLEVVAQRGMRLRQQLPDIAVDVHRSPLAGAQQRDHVEDPLVIGDDMAGATPENGIGELVHFSRGR
jgi:hypothetical protein